MSLTQNSGHFNGIKVYVVPAFYNLKQVASRLKSIRSGTLFQQPFVCIFIFLYSPKKLLKF